MESGNYLELFSLIWPDFLKLVVIIWVLTSFVAAFPLDRTLFPGDASNFIRPRQALIMSRAAITNSSQELDNTPKYRRTVGILNLSLLLCSTSHPSRYKMFHQHSALLFCCGGQSQVVLIYISWGCYEALGFPRQPWDVLLGNLPRDRGWRIGLTRKQSSLLCFILGLNRCFQQQKSGNCSNLTSLNV